MNDRVMSVIFNCEENQNETRKKRMIFTYTIQEPGDAKLVELTLAVQDEPSFFSYL